MAGNEKWTTDIIVKSFAGIVHPSIPGPPFKIGTYNHNLLAAAAAMSQIALSVRIGGPHADRREAAWRAVIDSTRHEISEEGLQHREQGGYLIAAIMPRMVQWASAMEVARLRPMPELDEPLLRELARWVALWYNLYGRLSRLNDGRSIVPGIRVKALEEHPGPEGDADGAVELAQLWEPLPLDQVHPELSKLWTRKTPAQRGPAIEILHQVAVSADGLSLRDWVLLTNPREYLPRLKATLYVKREGGTYHAIIPDFPFIQRDNDGSVNCTWEVIARESGELVKRVNAAGHRPKAGEWHLPHPGRVTPSGPGWLAMGMNRSVPPVPSLSDLGLGETPEEPEPEPPEGPEEDGQRWRELGYATRQEALRAWRRAGKPERSLQRWLQSRPLPK